MPPLGTISATLEYIVGEIPPEFDAVYYLKDNKFKEIKLTRNPTFEVNCEIDKEDWDTLI